MRKVTKAEFDAFTSGYGKPLRGSVVRICEPEELWVHDDSLTSYAGTDTLVAKVVYGWLGPNGEVDRKGTGKFYTYFIAADAPPEGT